MTMSPTSSDVNPARAGRTRMREFQSALTGRLRDARVAAQAHNMLAVRIGACDYLIELAEAGEIAAPGVITTVPWTQPWYVGVTSLRGQLVGVVDLACYRGQAPLPIDHSSCVLTFAPALRLNAALLVTRTLGLRDADGMSSVSASEALPGWLGPSLADARHQAFTPLSLARLAREESFLGAGR